MTKELTNDMLYDYRLVVNKDKAAECGYRIFRFGPTSKNSGSTLHELKVHKNTTHHKYGEDKTYYIIGFSFFGKQITIPLQRLIYAYYVDDIPEGYDIDHIDNNTLNNDPSNLQLLTRKDNIAKRFGKKNQYE